MVKNEKRLITIIYCVAAIISVVGSILKIMHVIDIFMLSSIGLTIVIVANFYEISKLKNEIKQLNDNETKQKRVVTG